MTETSYVVLLGDEAGKNINSTESERNSCYRIPSGYCCYFSNNNVFMGYLAGSSTTSGYSNTMIGFEAQEMITPQVMRTHS